MAQSLSKVILHIVFSTKNRHPWLKEPMRGQLHAYMGGIVRQLDQCTCYLAGGVEDHVHLAIRTSRTITIADLVQKIKSNSSRWIKQQDPSLSKFAWQNGYGAFSVSYRELPTLLDYIRQQEEHHRVRGFQEEYRAFLEENEIEFDEKYVWD